MGHFPIIKTTPAFTELNDVKLYIALHANEWLQHSGDKGFEFERTFSCD